MQSGVCVAAKKKWFIPAAMKYGMYIEITAVTSL